MYETEDDIRELQQIIDRSHARAGRHLRGIWTDDQRIPAAELPGLLPGVQLLAVATVTANGAPRVGPVDGLFYRGRFSFGSAGDSARFRHLRSRPEVSAAHIRGEELAIVVHGSAVEFEKTDPAHAEFLAYWKEVYPGWDTGAAPGNPRALIVPEAMFTFRRSPR